MQISASIHNLGYFISIPRGLCGRSLVTGSFVLLEQNVSWVGEDVSSAQRHKEKGSVHLINV